VQRKKGHQGDNRCAVRHGNHALVTQGVVRVDFRDDKRHARLHSKRGRIVDHNRARLDSWPGKFFGD
jgi:hypothetical protein